MNPSRGYAAERKAEILRAYQEHSSLHSIEGAFGVARQLVAIWLRQEAEALPVSPSPSNRLSSRMCWHWIRCEAASAPSRTNAGLGWHFVVAPDRLSPFASVSAAQRAVGDSGLGVDKRIVFAPPSVIAGKPTTQFLANSLQITSQLVRKRDKPFTLNGSITLPGSVWLALCAKPLLFPILMPFICMP